MMKIAVVGGGIFGSTAAWRLASEGYDVDLYEKNKEIILEASRINQYRVHRGYHYPRSAETTRQCVESAPSFERVYAEAIMNDYSHYYCIASGSLTSTEKFVEFCRKYGIYLHEEHLDIISYKEIESSFRVSESLVDPSKLTEICHEKFEEHGVNLIYRKANQKMLQDYDWSILATYSRLNELISPDEREEYQFEICEKAVVRMPATLRGISLVVLDGEFFCYDPHGRTGNTDLYDVVHSVHHSNVGHLPEVPKGYTALLNNGVIPKPSVTNFEKIIKSGAKFVPDLVKARYQGSMYTIRTVPAHREYDDARPTTVRKIGKRQLAIYSGKLPTCVDAADKVLRVISGDKIV